MNDIKREFITTSVFEKRWKEMSLTDDTLAELQNSIMQNLSMGAIVEGTGGAVKMRFALPNRGKSGSIRVIYVDLIKVEKIYLLTCYPKSTQDNLSNSEKSVVKEVIKRIIKNERGDTE